MHYVVHIKKDYYIPYSDEDIKNSSYYKSSSNDGELALSIAKYDFNSKLNNDTERVVQVSDENYENLKRDICNKLGIDSIDPVLMSKTDYDGLKNLYSQGIEILNRR